MTKDEFIEKVNFELLGNPENIIKDFLDYWTETSLNGKKMRFEGEKYFSIKRRFGTWKRNSLKFNKEQPSKMSTFLNNYEIAKGL